MRVLYLTLNPNRESTTVPTEGWFRQLRPQGLEPVLVSSVSGAFQRWALAEGVPCYEEALCAAPDLRRPWSFLGALARVVGIARRHRVELIHCNEHDVYPIGQYAARLLGIPVVVSVHFTLRDGYSRWAFSGARRPRRVFFVSQSNLEACRADVAGVVPEEDWRVLHNALDLEHYQRDDALRAVFRREHGLEEAFVLGAACALRPRKQLEHLFAAAARIDDPSVKVVLAGGAVAGDEAYAETLLLQGRELLGNRLVYLGHQVELRPLYNGLDLFVNTSQEESFGISVLEAMACGTPVVGYPSVSVAEVVLPDGGEIVPQDDIGALVRAVEQRLSRPEARSQGRTDARRRAAHFDIERISPLLWAEYAAVLGRTPARPAGLGGVGIHEL